MNEVFLYTLMTELLGCTVIWAKDNGPKLKAPFATLRVFGHRPIGMSEKRATESDGVYNLIRHYQATLEVKYVGSGAEIALVKMEQALEKNDIIERCAVSGIAFFDNHGTQDLTELIDNRAYEECAVIDLMMRYVVSIADNQGRIESVNFKEEGQHG